MNYYLSKILRITLFALLLILLAVVGFYFWAGSSWYDNGKYVELKTYDVPVEKQGDTLKIMTYNLGYLSGMTNNLPVARPLDLISSNLQQSVALFKKFQPDIIAFQEIDFSSDRSFNFNQADSIALRTSMPFSALAVNWDKTYLPFPYFPIKHHFGKMLSGQAVLSKMQIEKQKIEVLTKPLSAPFYYNHFYLDRLVQLVFLSTNNGDSILIMNTHLEAFDKATRVQQIDSVVALVKKFENQFPIILLGDFNTRPPLKIEGEELDLSLEKIYAIEGMEEAISKEEYLANQESFFTFDTEDPYERLDYIFYTSKSIKRIDAGVAFDAAEISDHFPVWMSFTLK